jgi:hypothetical protein
VGGPLAVTVDGALQFTTPPNLKTYLTLRSEPTLTNWTAVSRNIFAGFGHGNGKRTYLVVCDFDSGGDHAGANDERASKAEQS